MAAPKPTLQLYSQEPSNPQSSVQRIRYQNGSLPIVTTIPNIHTYYKVKVPVLYITLFRTPPLSRVPPSDRALRPTSDV